MTPSPDPKRSAGVRRLAVMVVAALLAALAGCKTTESVNGTRPQAAAPAASPVLGTGY